MRYHSTVGAFGLSSKINAYAGSSGLQDILKIGDCTDIYSDAIMEECSFASNARPVIRLSYIPPSRRGTSRYKLSGAAKEDRQMTLTKTLIVVITGLPRSIKEALSRNIGYLSRVSPYNLRVVYILVLSCAHAPELTEFVENVFTSSGVHGTVMYADYPSEEHEERLLYDITDSSNVRHNPARVRRMFCGLKLAAHYIKESFEDLHNVLCLRLRTDTILSTRGCHEIIKHITKHPDLPLLAAHPGNGIGEISDICFLLPSNYFLSIFGGSEFSSVSLFANSCSRFNYNPEWIFTNSVLQCVCRSESPRLLFGLYFGVDILLLRDSTPSTIESNYGYWVLSALSSQQLQSFSAEQLFIHPLHYPFGCLMLQRVLTHLGEREDGGFKSIGIHLPLPVALK
jgi:hypothetical protein